MRFSLLALLACTAAVSAQDLDLDPSALASYASEYGVDTAVIASYASEYGAAAGGDIDTASIAAAATSIAGKGASALEGISVPAGVESLVGAYGSKMGGWASSLLADPAAAASAAPSLLSSLLNDNPAVASIVGANPTLSSYLAEATGYVGGLVSSGSGEAASGSVETAALKTGPTTAAASSTATGTGAASQSAEDEDSGAAAMSRVAAAAVVSAFVAGVMAL
ncbi:hypothetical protein JCM8547_006478 [Rhodosporidiobolus lusitaniae]